MSYSREFLQRVQKLREATEPSGNETTQVASKTGEACEAIITELRHYAYDMSRSNKNDPLRSMDDFIDIAKKFVKFLETSKKLMKNPSNETASKDWENLYSELVK